MPIKVVSINIEGSKHLDRVEKFVAKQNPDVICLQEVFLHDMPRLEKAFGLTGFHSQNANIANPVSYSLTLGKWGIATFTKLPISHQEDYFYAGTREELPVMQEGNPNSLRRAVQITQVEHENKTHIIANTHLTWTPNGSVTEEQLQHTKVLLKYLKNFDLSLLVGDLNAPRGKATFSLFAEQYQDNIPADTISTLDPELHRAGALPLVVDSFFTGDNASASQVEVHTGVSDHRAISGLLE